MNAPLATIIVVTFNSARWLARQRAALDALKETRWRLIVFDNGSRESERPHLKDLPADATLMQSAENIGFAAGNNEAAAEAETPYLVFLNPDAFPEPDWLGALIAAADTYPKAAAVGSTQVRADDPNTFDGAGDVLHASGLAYRSNYGRSRSNTQPLGETFAACAAAMLVRRDAFDAVGGFDERFFCYFEDVDLCFRLRLAGWSVLQAPDAVVAHVGGGAASARSGFADFHGARNRLWSFVKNTPAPLFWPLLPLHLLASALASTAALRRGPYAWQGLIAGLRGWRETWRARQRLQRERRASWRDIARVLAWNPFVLLTRAPVIRRLR